MKIKAVLTLLILIAVSIKGYSQNELFLLGSIIDAETNAAIPFATIIIKQNQLGTIANAEGDFRIKQSSVSFKDSLLITCIGYHKNVVPVRDFVIGQVTEVFLKPKIEVLKEVEVHAKKKKIRSQSIVRKAIHEIPNNCAQDAFRYIAYYRDYQKLNSQYLNLSEAIFENKDKDFNEDQSSSRFRLLSVRENDEFETVNFPEEYNDGTQAEKVRKSIPGATLSSQGGNELFILLVHDAIRRNNQFAFSFVGKMRTNFVANHEFGEIELVYNDKLALYKIDFISRKWKTSDSIVAKGSIYIEPENYAIHNLNYSAFYHQKGHPPKAMFNVTLEYGRVPALDSQMGLKFISFNNMFQAYDERDETYFKVEEAYIDTSLSRRTVTFEMNQNVDVKSAINKKNYQISFGEEIAKIRNIVVQKTRIIVFLSDGSFDFKLGRFEIFNVKDVNGRIINKKQKLEVYQFRELFVQEFNPNIKIQTNCYMKNLPLSENCINKIKGENKYWMNTPAGVGAK